MSTKKTSAKKTTTKKAASKKAAKVAAPAAVAAVAAAPAAEPTTEQLEAACKKALKTYGHRPNVTGVDIGFRYKNEKRLPSLGVRIHVQEKIAPEALEAAELLPQQIDGVPVDVIQAVYKPHAQMMQSQTQAEPEAAARKTRLDPIQPGISVSHPNVTSGTLGTIVYDRTTGHRGILSNWHVLVGSLDATPGDAVVQPGRAFGGRTPQDRIGSLKRFILNEFGDAAFAILSSARQINSAQVDTGIDVRTARKVKIGEVLEKSGVTTAVTRGLVDGVGTYTLNYTGAGDKTITGFKIVAEKDGNPDNLEISGGGDSGALWYAADDHQGVGLHFAGERDPNPAAEHAIACHLPDVLEKLDISLTPIGPVPPPPQAEDEVPLAAGRAISSERLIIETVARLSRVLEAAYLKSSEKV